jgi:6-phosphogluconolactonase (cycloisomerase 2 family)
MRSRHGTFSGARLAPLMVGLLAAAVLIGGEVGCGKGLYSQASSNSSATATATATAGVGAFAYASNFNDAVVSEFKRHATTGALTWVGQTKAGAKSGPMGLAVTPDDKALYVVNQADNDVYEFGIDSGGTLSPIGTTGSVAAGTTPKMIAIDSTGSWAYVTNYGSGSISEYSINSTTHALTALTAKVTGFSGPFAIATLVLSSKSLVYVADSTAGIIYAFTIGSGGALSNLGQITIGGTPGLMAIGTDLTSSPAVTYLFVDDIKTGYVSELAVNTDGTLALIQSFPGAVTGNANNTIGIGLATNGGTQYLFTADSLSNSVAYFTWGSGVVTLLGALTLAAGAPTGLVTDPQEDFVYTGDAGNGKIAAMQINCTAGQPLCTPKYYNSEKPYNATAGTQYLTLTH